MRRVGAPLRLLLRAMAQPPLEARSTALRTCAACCAYATRAAGAQALLPPPPPRAAVLPWLARSGLPAALLRFSRGAHGRPWQHRAAVAAGAAGEGEGVMMTPIGTFEGPFRRRNGTPRQGVLAPRARGTVRLRGDALAHGAADTLAGLSGYSHAFLLFHFHANTPSRAAAKVAPPRLGGARVGVFATRAPHRPNAIGLSVVRVESVEGSCLHVSGADLLHGTPILDIKPYVPGYDAHPAAHVPDWLSAAPDTAPHTVRWSADALAGLAAAAPRLRFLRGAEDAQCAVEDALRSELRSAYRRRDCGDAPYGFFLDVLDVRCSFDDAARAVDVTHVAYAPYDQPADAGDGVGGDVAAADAAVFRALLSTRGLAARVSDAGVAGWRANGVLLGAPVGAAHAGAPATLRYDWRAATLRAALPGGAEQAWDVHALCAATAKGCRPLRALGLFLLRGPLPGGAASWLRPAQKLGVVAMREALMARPPLSDAQFAAWEAEAAAADGEAAPPGASSSQADAAQPPTP
jgi:tRNA-Thr(GGU) m(6)t(6)A37 methyltransferase TsaA